MNTFKLKLPALLLLAGMGFASTASASLETRLGGQAVYDTDLNITWLADANLAASNTFGVGISNANGSGTMTWDQAQNWVAAMDTANYLGYSDWRLPTVGPVNGSSFQYGFSNNGSTDFGYGNTSPMSEMAYMYYVNLGNLGYCTPNGGNPGGCSEQPGWGLTNVGPFTNLQPYAYWSGTEYAPQPDLASVFFTYRGSQLVDDKGYNYYAWAVRSGDVAAVPLPAAVWLFGSALSGLTLLGVRRRRG